MNATISFKCMGEVAQQVKVSTTKHDLRWIPGKHAVEEKHELPQTVLWPPQAHYVYMSPAHK